MAGRIYPFSYKKTVNDTSEYFSGLLRRYSKETKWLLDLRADPEDSWSEYRGEWLRDSQAPQQYLRVLSDHVAAVNGIATLLQRGESFVLFHDDWSLIKDFETKVYQRAKERGVVLEDPYSIHAGDLCLWTNEYEHVENALAVVNFRTPDVYVFHATAKEKIQKYGRESEVSGWADLKELRLVESGTFFCQECKKGEVTTQWREKTGKKLCNHCNRLLVELEED